MNKAVFLGAVLVLLSLAIRAETIILNLEEPKAAGTYTGISNLRGWAVAESGVAAIEIDIDGVYAFDVPMGGTRGDVARAYPDFPDAETSGFSMAFNYKGLAPGEYLFTARAISNDGGVALQTAAVTVDRFVSSFIDDVAKVDTTTVSEVLFAESTLTLKGVSVEGQEWDVALGFDTATQGFEVTGITAVGAPGGGAACAASNWTSGDYTLEQQGVERAFRVRVPANYDSCTFRSFNCGISWVGRRQGEFLDNATVQSESDQRGYIVVAPLGLGKEAPDNRLSSWSFQGSTTGLDGDGVNPSVPATPARFVMMTTRPTTFIPPVRGRRRTAAHGPNVPSTMSALRAHWSRKCRKMCASTLTACSQWVARMGACSSGIWAAMRQALPCLRR